MASSSAVTVREYLTALPSVRRQVVAAIREVILRHLPDGYAETMNWGMISYEIPLARYPETYNGHPLSYVIGKIVASTSPAQFIARYELSRRKLR
jgi:hypothetical protein